MHCHLLGYSIRIGHSRKVLPLVICLSLLGCSASHRVQPDVAEKTLRTTLEAWKNGQAADSLQKGTPPIVVQDLDWVGGSKLVNFEILPGGKPVDANLYAQVKLTLLDSKGSESERTVTYVVGTSPVLTVFRDMMR